MRSYSETHVFSARELKILQQATEIVAGFPGEPELRCHEVARAVGHLLGLEVQDGKYGIVEHSWLWLTPEPHTAILDVYCVGRLPQVQIVDLCGVLPHGPRVEGRENAHDWYATGYECATTSRSDIRHDAVLRLVDSTKPQPSVDTRRWTLTEAISAAARAGAALNLIATAPYAVSDEACIKSMDEGLALCQMLKFGIESEMSSTFSVRSLEAVDIVRSFYLLPDGEKTLKRVDEIVATVKRLREGDTRSGIESAAFYFTYISSWLSLKYRMRR